MLKYIACLSCAKHCIQTTLNLQKDLMGSIVFCPLYMSGVERLGNLFKVAELRNEFRVSNHLGLSLTDGSHWTLDF